MTGRAEPSREELRRRALWYAELATARPGFVGRLVKRFGSLDEALRLAPRQMQGAFPREAMSREEGLFAAVLKAGPPAAAELVTRPPEGAAGAYRVVTYVDDDYPEALHQLTDPPPALFLSGRVDDGLTALAERVTVAIVGSRSPSPYGREMAEALGRDLAATGVVVLSGMALGIDTVAQKAALEAADGLATVGVLGCGVDHDHPPGNRTLFAQVRRRGLLVSEFTWGALPLPWRFPCRNRILAALAAAVIVVEGGERSGARITARHGLDLGREVLAVPGEAGRRLSACPHQLLREGAPLCESARDVFDALGLQMSGRASADPTPALLEGMSGGADLAAVLAALDAGPRSADDLAALVRRPVGAVLAALTELELQGQVGLDGDRYRRRRGGSETTDRTRRR